MLFEISVFLIAMGALLEILSTIFGDRDYE